jgi:hypothetical protein
MRRLDPDRLRMRPRDRSLAFAPQEERNSEPQEHRGFRRKQKHSLVSRILRALRVLRG